MNMYTKSISVTMLVVLFVLLAITTADGRSNSKLLRELRKQRKKRQFDGKS